MHTTDRWTDVRPARGRIVMWGAGDQGRVNYHILRSLGCTIDALIDDTPGLESPFADVPLFRGLSGLDRFLESVNPSDLGFVVAIANPFGRARLDRHRSMQQRGLTALSFADPTALICRSAAYGEGLQVMPAAIVHNDAVIGTQCIINTRALVEHDCVLGNGVEIAPGAVLCGRVTVGTNSWICANATIRPRVTIGANAIIGAGAAVVTDIPDNAIAVGVPARVVGENKARE